MIYKFLRFNIRSFISMKLLAITNNYFQIGSNIQIQIKYLQSTD